MKNRITVLLICFLAISGNLAAQSISLQKNNLEEINVFASSEKLEGQTVLKIVVDTSIKSVNQPTFVKIKNSDFKNGIIEVKLLSRLMKNAPESARGFIGLAFRIDTNHSKFESFYVRPTNGRADDQIRRNHSTQYFSYPDYDFDRLRKESPEKYESYADMGLNEWITLRIEVKGSKAKLYVNASKQPSLIVNDLKLGENQAGAVGLWVGNFTEGYFKDLKISKMP